MHQASSRTAAAVVVGLLGALGLAGVGALAAPPAGPLAAGICIALLLLAAAAGGSPLTTAVLRLADRVHQHALAVSGSLPHPAMTSSMSNPGLLRGGATLGVLERVATFATLAADFPEGLAVVVAVKGLGRFAELKVAAAGERFMIGTLTSLVWAASCWAVAVAVLH